MTMSTLHHANVLVPFAFVITFAVALLPAIYARPSVSPESLALSDCAVNIFAR